MCIFQGVYFLSTSCARSHLETRLRCKAPIPDNAINMKNVKQYVCVDKVSPSPLTMPTPYL